MTTGIFLLRMFPPFILHLLLKAALVAVRQSLPCIALYTCSSGVYQNMKGYWTTVWKR